MSVFLFYGGFWPWFVAYYGTGRQPVDGCRDAEFYLMNNIIIRRAAREDGPALVRLILALADFEHLTPPDAEAQARLITDGFGDPPRFETWMAWVPGEKEPVGYALFFETYSTFLARPTLYLEDLFVLPQHRHHGAGKALFRQGIRLAWERGCGRMEWSCLDWNIKARAFYEKMGARHLRDWCPYRLTRDQMPGLLS
jgi:GNAT superfamily N-acetyltransferase